MKKAVIFFILFTFLFTLSASTWVIDNADLLSDEEERNLSYKLENVKSRTGISAVVLTENSTHGYSTRSWADLFIEKSEYGSDGVILFLNMGEREYYISTTGYAMYALNSASLSDYNLEGVLFPYLSEGEYYTAFSSWADYVEKCASERTRDEYNERYSASEKEVSGKKSFSPLPPLFYSLFLGFFISFLFVSNKKRKLRNIGAVNNADDFVVPSSFHISIHKDIFLYSNTTMVRINNDNHSSTHSSPSGVSHGGRGGCF